MNSYPAPRFAIGQPVVWLRQPARHHRVLHRDIKLDGWHYYIVSDRQDWDKATDVHEKELLSCKVHNALKAVEDYKPSDATA